MIRNIAYFPSQCALNSGPVLAAALSSLTRAGVILESGSMTADAAIIWSVLWHGRMQANRLVYDHYRTNGRPVVIIDVGTLHRGHTWKVSVNHTTALGYYGHTENLDFDRPNKLKLPKSTKRKSRAEILVASQHRASLQTQDLDLEIWIAQMISDLRQYTDRDFIVRDHPRSRLDGNRLPPRVVRQQPARLKKSYDSYDFDADYHAIINYNSGPGIMAGVVGTPVLVHESSLARPISFTAEKIDQPPIIDREQWLVEISHTEYTIEEIEQGLWLKRLVKQLPIPGL